MRTPAFHIMVLVIALVLAGCSALPGASVPSALDGGLSSSSAVVVATPSPTAAPSATSGPAATRSPSAVVSPEASPTPATSTAADAASVAIQATIERANQEQQDAFARGDPTLMRHMATSEYYDQLVQINAGLADAGVTAIELVKLEWGQITLTSPTTAQAITFETWRTTYGDGSTDQRRDKNVYTLALEEDAWKIQSDEHPDAGQEDVYTAPAPADPGTVSPALPLPRDETDISRNWSGYAATGGEFTAVAGTWTVPESQPGDGLASGAAWVGIGGVRTRDLIQAGTMAVSDGSGAVHYQAWVETLPQPARPVPFAISPGDSVSVSISEQSPDRWLITMENHSTGQRYEKPLSYASSRSSAEWIMEAPSTRRRIVPLDDFGAVHFSNGSAVRDGQLLTIAEAGAQPITMVDRSGDVLAAPSALTADGQGFSVSRSDSEPMVAPGQRRSGF